MNGMSPYMLEQLARDRMQEFHDQADQDRRLKDSRGAVQRAKASRDAEPRRKPVLAPNS